MSWHRTAAAAIAIAAVCFLIARGNGYQVFIIVTVGLTAIVGVGLNVLLGLSGQISLGHVAFYAIGAYAVGILTTNHDWPFWPALVVAAIVSGLAGILLAIPALRVRGPYLAMVTIAFGFVVEQSAAEWQGLTGGWNGLSGIPGPAIFGSDIGEKGIPDRLVDKADMSEHRHLGANEGAPEGVRVKAVRVGEHCLRAHVLEPGIMEVASQIGADEIIVDRLAEDGVESLERLGIA